MVSPTSRSEQQALNCLKQLGQKLQVGVVHRTKVNQATAKIKLGP
jgi:hypothetical protein